MTRANALTSRLAGYAIGAAIVFVILAVQLPPLAPLWLCLAIVSGVVGGILAITAFRLVRGDASVRNSGLLGRATILRATPTGRTRGDEAEIDLEVEVLVPGRERFVARRRQWLRDKVRASIVLGRSVPLTGHLDDPDGVVLAFDHERPEPQAIAGPGAFAGTAGGVRTVDPEPAHGADGATGVGVSQQDPLRDEPAADR